MTEAHVTEKPECKPQLVVGRTMGGLVPRNVEELWRFAQMVAASGMAPKGLDRPEAVAVAITMGMEVGLAPMAAVQNIAVINGRPAVWGDAALGLVMASGLLAEFSETPIEDGQGNVVGYQCRAVRRGIPEPIVRRFTRDQAKLAGLAGKSGPWSQYPERMMQMRARSWCLRDGFADVLRGLSIREEVQDIVDTPATAETVKPGRSRFGPPRRHAAEYIHPPAPRAAERAPAPAPEDPPATTRTGPEQSDDAAGTMDRAELIKRIEKALAGGDEAVTEMVDRAKRLADVTQLDDLPANTLADIAASI